MKIHIGLILASIGVVAAADFTAWQWEAPFEIGQEGMVRLELSPAVLDVSRPDLGDIRLLAPGQSETPYLVTQHVYRPSMVRDTVGFKVSMSGQSTVIEVASGTGDSVQWLQLISPAHDFLKSVTIEGRKGTGEWQALAANEVIFRQSDGAERTRVPLPVGVWEGFRVTVSDDRSRPIPFTGIRLVVAADKPETFDLPVTSGSQIETSGETRVTLDLGSSNLYVAELRFGVSDPVFSRTCSLSFSSAPKDRGGGNEILASGNIYRVQGDHGSSTEDLVIPIHRRVPARYLIASFHNGDSPPLTFKDTGVRCYPTILVFHAAQPGPWRLFTGNRGVKTPVYDLNPLRGSIDQAGGLLLKPGAVQSRAEYVAPPVLPDVEPVGTDIGLTDWSRRCLLRSAPAGVVHVELDASVLAGCRPDLGDLRLVQNGRQVPYLIVPDTVSRELKPSKVTSKKDPKRPTVSLWEISLPVNDLPVMNLTAVSKSPIFARRFLVTIDGRDELGNSWTNEVGAVDWTKTGADGPPLFLNLAGRRMPAKFLLETDHGDNPPFQVDDIAVRFAAPSIAAKVADGAPVYLYYGNSKASPPLYDLRLMRNELLAADHHSSALGDEEILRKMPVEPTSIDAGSPWLWIALAGVVGVLLIIVAKLLPRSAVN